MDGRVRPGHDMRCKRKRPGLLRTFSFAIEVALIFWSLRLSPTLLGRLLGQHAFDALDRGRLVGLFDGGEASLDELIHGVGRGLLVTHFWYIRFVNLQTVQHTGLTRDGLFLIEDGKITQPVMNFRFNDSPVQLLENAVKLGRPVRVRGLEGAQMIVPPVVATEFSFTSVSDAV